jgi:S1-C subfamily serine protease
MPSTVRALALCCLIPALQGCLIVVDHEDSVRWSSDDDLPRHAVGVYLDSVGHATAAQLGLDRERVTLIESVTHDSAADRAGLQRYDIITAIDGDTDASPSRVRQAIRAHKPGDTISLTILRRGQQQTISVKK